MSRRLESAALGAAALLLWLTTGYVAAQEKTDFSGLWQLNHELSDNVQAKIEAAAGPEQLKGSSGISVLPRAGNAKEVDRVRVRQFLIDRMGAFETEEIEQDPSEIKLVHGEDNVRIFYFGREHVRNDALGNKLKCRSRWMDQQLVIEEESETGTRITDLLTLVPARHQLIHALRVEASILKEPLELRLVYDQSQAAKPN